MERETEQLERSRAAVAVACLRWLGCTGPSDRAEAEFPRADRPIPDLDPIRFLPPTPEPGPAHPLWDRWLDSPV